MERESSLMILEGGVSKQSADDGDGDALTLPNISPFLLVFRHPSNSFVQKEGYLGLFENGGNHTN